MQKHLCAVSEGDSEAQDINYQHECSKGGWFRGCCVEPLFVNLCCKTRFRFFWRLHIHPSAREWLLLRQAPTKTPHIVGQQKPPGGLFLLPFCVVDRTTMLPANRLLRSLACHTRLTPWTSPLNFAQCCSYPLQGGGFGNCRSRASDVAS